MIPQPVILPGEWTIAGLPTASSVKGKIAWVTDRVGGAGPMVSNGTSWQLLMSGMRVERFTGTTNGSGLFSGTFSPAFNAIPAISCERTPTADSQVTLRVTALSTSGFTVIAERRAVLTVLAVEVLAGAVTAAASQAVSVLAVGD